MKARLIDKSSAFGETIIRLSVSDGNELDQIEKGAELEISTPKRKRSLNANSYYHKLCRELCEKIGVPMSIYHNTNLAEMGIPKRKADGNLIFSFHPIDYHWEEDLEKHYKPLPGHETEINGIKMYLCCEVLGSSEYNSKQMSTLIDNVIADCKEAGVETEPKEYIDSLIERWKGVK